MFDKEAQHYFLEFFNSKYFLKRMFLLYSVQILKNIQYFIPF